MSVANDPEILAALKLLNQKLGAAGVGPDYTIDFLCDAFARAKKDVLRAWSDEEGRLKHLRPFFGALRWNEVTYTKVDDYRDQRRGETTKQGKLTSPATRNREVELLHRVFRFAVKRRLIPYNPIDGVEMEPENNIRQVVIRFKVFVKIFRAARPILRAFILALYDSGMRRTEVLRLQWDQIDFETGLVDLSANDTKTKEPRVSILSKRAIREIRSLPRDMRSPYVFASPYKVGEPYSKGYFYDLWCEAIEAANVVGPNGGRVWVHDLRRSFITLARRDHNVPESTIREISGHRTDSAFRRYNIQAVEDLLAAKSKMDADKPEPTFHDRVGPKAVLQKVLHTDNALGYEEDARDDTTQLPAAIRRTSE